MRPSIELALGLALLSAVACPLHASVTAGSPLTGEPTSSFPAVGRFGTTWNLNGSGTAVFDGNYVLTARHPPAARCPAYRTGAVFTCQ